MRFWVGLYFPRPSSGYTLYLPWLQQRNDRGISGESPAEAETNQGGDYPLFAQKRYKHYNKNVF